MRIAFKNIIDLSLLLIFYAGFQGGKYFMNNRMQELGFAITLSIFLYAAIRLAYQPGFKNWSWWFWSAPLMVGYLMFSAALSFAFFAGTPLMPSLFGTREFIIIFLAPTIFFIYKLGYPIARIEKFFIIALVIIVLNYLFHYFRIDLPSAYFSTGYTSYLVTYDEWRGYRLKPPLIALVIMTLYTGFRLVQKDKDLLKTIGLIILAALIIYIWFLVKARSQMATIVLAVLLYPLFFSRPLRFNFFILAAPVVVLFIAMLGGLIVDKFFNAEGAEVRAASYATAFENIAKRPFFGHGQSSAYSLTYQDIFGKKFYPTDLGIVGTVFKYGLVGGFIYLFFNFFIFYRLIKFNWYYRYIHQRHNLVLWSLLVLTIAMSVNIILNPVLAMMQGLTFASFTIGLTSCYAEEYKNY
jgi:hypothetical protein